VYDQLKGVVSVESGYMGGKTPAPTYAAVCGGATGHAEVVRVTYDPAEVSYEDLLSVFFAIHDPTTPNRQGNDVGTQYRSAIFFHTPEQEKAARAVVERLAAEKLFRDPIVTEIVPAATFYQAEEDHQEYFARVGGGNPYCSFVIEPKVAKFRKHFVEKLKRP
jgi:peptide-methionine (S)-S-oxide reductase